ncbi:MAG: ferrous iron transport protein A [Puniceicoccales bacterium]|jgi:Fe2+ transport system protein FeoA|nr:ferrous iron transport protein A [Puniceicoccales bacterium]
MVRLDRVEESKCCRVCRIEADGAFICKLLPMGISIGNRVEMVYNRRFVPILLGVGDSLIAIDRRKARTIFVEEEGNVR